MAKKKNNVVKRGKGPYYPTDYSVGEKKPPVVKSVKPEAPIMKKGEWFKLLFWGLFPVINLIALTAWIKKDNNTINPNQRNFAKAALTLTLIFWVVAIVAFAAVAYFVLGLF